MKKASKIIAIFIFTMSIFVGVGAVEVFADTASQTNTVNEPVKFIAKQKGKKVVLKWNKSKNVKGYIIYKNGKKFKTLKKNKLTDKKVKKNKVYSYKIKAYTIANGKKVFSNSGQTVSIIVTDKKSKKVNAGRFKYIKNQYTISLNGKVKLQGEAYPSKKLKKKKVLSRKLTWSSSDTSLATVNARGIVKANNNMKTGTVIIYAKAHNGLTKKVKINIENYAYPSKIKKMYMLSDDIKPLVTEHMAEMTKIVSYFEFENKNNETTFDIDDKGNLSMSKKISISSEMEKTIFNLISSMPITVEVHKGYVAFNRIDFTVYDTGIINSIAYVFQGMENVDTGYERIEIAPNWYYQYGEFSKGYFEEEQE